MTHAIREFRVFGGPTDVELAALVAVLLTKVATGPSRVSDYEVWRETRLAAVRRNGTATRRRL